VAQCLEIANQSSRSKRASVSRLPSSVHHRTGGAGARQSDDHGDRWTSVSEDAGPLQPCPARSQEEGSRISAHTQRNADVAGSARFKDQLRFYVEIGVEVSAPRELAAL
jgi:hypothetical protein